MKKILLVALAAAAMVGCSQNEEIDNISKNAEIKVTPVVKGTTRAAVVNNDNFAAFTVKGYAVVTADIPNTGVGTAFMSQDYTGKQGAWNTTSGDAYWPLNKAMHFFAYPTSGVTYAASGTGYPTIEFKIAATAGAQTDLVVAHTSLADKPSNNALALLFKHILTRVNFSYEPADPQCTYTVSKITINDVQGGTAMYTFDESNGSWGDGSETAVDYDYTIGTPVADGDSFKLDAADGNGSLMLLPQDVAGKKISITYTTVKAGENLFNGTKTVDLPTGATWGIGQNIRYNLTLPVGAEKVTVTTNVEDINEDKIEGDAQ